MSSFTRNTHELIEVLKYNRAVEKYGELYKLPECDDSSWLHYMNSLYIRVFSSFSNKVQAQFIKHYWDWVSRFPAGIFSGGYLKSDDYMNAQHVKVEIYRNKETGGFGYKKIYDHKDVQYCFVPMSVYGVIELALTEKYNNVRKVTDILSSSSARHFMDNMVGWFEEFYPNYYESTEQVTKPSAKFLRFIMDKTKEIL